MHQAQSRKPTPCMYIHTVHTLIGSRQSLPSYHLDVAKYVSYTWICSFIYLWHWVCKACFECYTMYQALLFILHGSKVITCNNSSHTEESLGTNLHSAHATINRLTTQCPHSAIYYTLSTPQLVYHVHHRYWAYISLAQGDCWLLYSS